MTLDGVRRDAILLGGVVAHPVRQWRAWRDLAVELFREGGATIDTPPAPEHQPIRASTVIQADGDVLVFVEEGTLEDHELLATHAQRVGEWYARSRGTVRQAAVALRAAAFTISGAVAAVCGLITSSVVNRLAGLALFSALLTAGSWLFGMVASAVFRRRIDRILRRRGVAA